MSQRGICDQLLDLLFPPRCQVCGGFSVDPICETCRGTIEFIKTPPALQILRSEQPPICPCCGIILQDQAPENLPGALCADCRSGRWVSATRSAGLHVGALRSAIIRYKFHGRRQLARTFAEMLVDVVREETAPASGPGLPLDLCDALVPVPLHPKRLHWRGFNQAELLCAELSEQLHTPVLPDVLERVRDTSPQTRLSGVSRRKNVSGAFNAVKPWRVVDRSFMLVDDVFTTGATLDECARVLKRAGATAVYGLTVSRAAPRWHPAAWGSSSEPGDSAKSSSA